MKVTLYFIPEASFGTLNPAQFKAMLGGATTVAAEATWPGLSAFASGVYDANASAAKNAAAGIVSDGPFQVYTKSLSAPAAAPKTAPTPPSTTNSVRPREWNDAAREGIRAIGLLWKGDDTQAADYVEIQKQAHKWCSLSPGYADLIFSKSTTPPSLTAHPAHARSAGVEMLAEIPHSGHANTIVTADGVIDDPDPRALLKAIEDHYNFDGPLARAQRDDLMLEMQYLGGFNTLTDWQRHTETTYAQLKKVCKSKGADPSWAASIPTEEAVVKTLMEGHLSHNEQCPYPEYLSTPINAITMMAPTDPRVPKTISAFFDAMHTWENANRWMIPTARHRRAVKALKKRPVSERVGTRPERADHQTKYGVRPSDWGGKLCYHMLVPMKSGDTLNHRTAPVQGPGGMQCPYGHKCFEIQKADRYMREHHDPNWKPPRRPAPTPRPQQGRSKKGEFTKGHFKQCDEYLRNGFCSKRGQCPKAQYHGKRAGVQLPSDELQRIRKASTAYQQKIAAGKHDRPTRTPQHRGIKRTFEAMLEKLPGAIEQHVTEAIKRTRPDKSSTTDTITSPQADSALGALVNQIRGVMGGTDQD